jgi:hypothetical protein
MSAMRSTQIAVRSLTKAWRWLGDWWSNPADAASSRHVRSCHHRPKPKRRVLRHSLPLEALESRVVAAVDTAIGMNLESVVDWSSAWTFKDAFQTSRPWISHAYNTATGQETWEGGGAVQVDSKGWPTQLNQWVNSQGQAMQQRLGTLMFRDIGTAYPAGIYRAEWEGTGSVSFGFAAHEAARGTTADGKHYALLDVQPTADGIYVKVADMSSADPIRNLRVWMPDANGQAVSGQPWQPGAASSPFHPTFLDKLAPFKTLRFMDWAETNITDIEHWTDRRPYDHATQQSGDFHNGVAPEYMVELCNELDADGWFNMPHAADDDFVRNFATLVRDSLEPGRKAYVEWSNELWNFGWGFEASAWVTDQLALPGNADLNGDRWKLVAREAKRDFDIWTEVFAGQTERLVRVVAGQQANSWIANEIASNMNGHFDAISCATYMYVTDHDRSIFSSTTTADQVIDALTANLPTTLGWVQAHKNVASSWSTTLGRPIQLVAYEGGPHLDSQGGSYGQAFFAASTHPRMYDVYTQWLAGLEQVGLDLHLHYTFTGGLYPSNFGEFGALQSMTQTTATAPKYRALLDAAQNAPPSSVVYLQTVAGTAKEAGPVAGKWRITRSGATSETLTIQYTLGGTASSADYTGFPASLTFSPGETYKLITITPVDDVLVDHNETLVLTLQAGAGYTVDATRATGKITIVDNDYLQGLQGAYYDNKGLRGLKFKRLDPNVQFDWALGSPDARIAADTFSVRWTGRLKPIETGNYVFRTVSDDGVRLSVAGSRRIDNWTNHTETINLSGNVGLVAGKPVAFTLDYFDNLGASVIRLEWKRPGSSVFEVIPSSQFLAPATTPAPAPVAAQVSGRSAPAASQAGLAMIAAALAPERKLAQ